MAELFLRFRVEQPVKRLGYFFALGARLNALMAEHVECQAATRQRDDPDRAEGSIHHVYTGTYRVRMPLTDGHV